MSRHFASGPVRPDRPHLRLHPRSLPPQSEPISTASLPRRACRGSPSWSGWPPWSRRLQA